MSSFRSVVMPGETALGVMTEMRALAGVTPQWGLHEAPQKRVPKPLVDKAVKAAQMYIGSEGTPAKTQERFYRKMLAAVNKIASVSGMDSGDVLDKITARARSLGKISPMPGKDY